MSAPVDVLADLRRISAQLSHYDDSARLWCPTLDAAAAAVAELIERDKAAQIVFDCILRGVNDGNASRFADGWLQGWAKRLLAAGFTPSNPDAADIRGALARVGGAS